MYEGNIIKKLWHSCFFWYKRESSFKNCKNCKAFITMESTNGIIRRECAFTFNGLVVLPNCPCQECMINIVCHERCDDLQHAIDKLMKKLREYE